MVPLSRHSPLPELQEFVKLFRPKRVVPNTLDPRLYGLDWAYIERVFAPYLCPISDTRDVELDASPVVHDALDPRVLNDGDVALKNLVGSGASDVAERWADDGKLLKKLSFIKSYLGDEESQLIDTLLGIRRPEERIRPSFPVYDKPNIPKFDPPKLLERSTSPNHARDNEDDSDEDSNDERGRTAHALFANLAGIDPEDKENACWFTSPTSSAEKQPASSVSRSGGGGEPKDGTWRLNRIITPVSSPVRIPPHKPSIWTPPKHSVRRIRAIEGRSTFPVQTPANQSRKQSVLIHVEDLQQLASPFCLRSSSPPAVQIGPETQGPVRVSSPHEAPVGVFKPQPLHTEHGFSSLDLTNTSAYKMNLENRHEHLPSDTSVPETPPNLPHSAASSSTPSSQKRPPDDIESISKTKKRRLKPNSRDEEPETLGFECSKHDGSSSPVSLRKPISHQLANVESKDTRSAVAWVPTEREYWHRRRITMSQKIAEALPDIVAPSFQKKRRRQLAQVERKGKDRTLAASSSDNQIKDTDSAKPLPMPGGMSNRRKLMAEPTLLSFESVHDENESKMDWNRSKLLAEAIRHDVANGRKPVIPPLQCAQSQSP